MYCPHCKESNPTGAKFCGACGQKIEAARSSGTFDSVFKWIGIVVVGLFVVGLLLGA